MVNPGPERRTLDLTRDDALGASDLTELLTRLTERDVSPAELWQAATVRAHAANEHLNAITHWFDEPLPTKVHAPPDAPFAGIPTFVKDNEEVAGYPTTQGSGAVVDRPAGECSPIVTALLELGLAPMAATTLPEFGLTASTESTRFGSTRNPWDLGRTAGGSSGGAAALVAAGVVPMAHGNDGGGSIRIPASSCGLVGLKPSRGRLPMNPLKQKIPVRIAAQGVLTRSVRDTALFYAQMDQLRPAPGLPSIGHVTAPAKRRLRIGLCVTTARGLPVHPETLAAARSAAMLCAGLGHRIEEVGPPVDDQFAHDFLLYWSLLALFLHRGGGAFYGRGFRRDQLEDFTVGLSELALRNGAQIPGAVRRLRRVAREPQMGYQNLDLLISPVTGYPAPPLGYLGPETPFREHLVRLIRFASMTPLQNVSGQPAISLPMGRTSSGLPIGVQVAAPLGHERRLLQLSLELEQAAAWPTRPTATTSG